LNFQLMLHKINIINLNITSYIAKDQWMQRDTNKEANTSNAHSENGHLDEREKNFQACPFPYVGE